MFFIVDKYFGWYFLRIYTPLRRRLGVTTVWTRTGRLRVLRFMLLASGNMFLALIGVLYAKYYFFWLMTLDAKEVTT